MNEQPPVVALRGVSYSTPAGRRLGCDVSFELGRGEVLLVTGPNGSGKSTLLELILGRRRCDSGLVQLNIPGSSVSYLPQLHDSETHMPFSLRDVLTMSLATADKEIIQEGLLTKEQLDLGWNSASGGEKRRALLTRTILQRPELIILDEPFNHLDGDSRRVIMSSISRFVTTMNKTVILSTHERFADAANLAKTSIKHLAL